MIDPSQAAGRIPHCIPRNLCAAAHPGDLSVYLAGKPHHDAQTGSGILGVDGYLVDVSNRLDETKPKTAPRNRMTVWRTMKPPEYEFMFRRWDAWPIVANAPHDSLSAPL